MGKEMYTKANCGGSGDVANWACIWPLSGVSSLVVNHGLASGESLLTNWALNIRSIYSMNGLFVCEEIGRRTESFGTLLVRADEASIGSLQRRQKKKCCVVAFSFCFGVRSDGLHSPYSER
mmetsp:Transcript_16239/g.40001  ORF Transcript_16239/g.40001 Transcript_16239/m.40001 type:complete len:121 (-) Transcript_16239:455-817(-)